VDSMDTLRRAEDLLEISLFSSQDEVKFVGVDSEWKASIVGSRHAQSGKNSQSIESASILQLGTRDHVIIFDFFVLNQSGMSSGVLHSCGTLLQRIFCDPTVVKIGWGLELDMSMLSSVCGGMYAGLFAQTRSILNLEKSMARIRRRTIVSVDEDGAEQKSLEPIITSLTKACEAYLGKPLNKKEQISDWEMRPLLPTQIAYASLDAHSLLGVLSVLCANPTADLLAIRSVYSRVCVSSGAVIASADKNDVSARALKFSEELRSSGDGSSIHFPRPSIQFADLMSQIA
jgi:hypothetical protein